MNVIGHGSTYDFDKRSPVSALPQHFHWIPAELHLCPTLMTLNTAGLKPLTLTDGAS